MSPVIDKESHQQFVERIAIERAELAREIKAGNYARAANIAQYIHDEVAKHNTLWKEGRP